MLFLLFQIFNTINSLSEGQSEINAKPDKISVCVLSQSHKNAVKYICKSILNTKLLTVLLAQYTSFGKYSSWKIYMGIAVTGTVITYIDIAV